MEELLVVTTGGTIDKVYFDDKSDYQVGDPQIGRILQALGVPFHRDPDHPQGQPAHQRGGP